MPPDRNTIQFMGLPFLSMSLNEIIDQIIKCSKLPKYGFIVTPNVDHINKFHTGGIDQDVYKSAAFMINDSRILETLAKLARKTLPATPGSDIVAALLHHPRAPELRIAVVGPSPQDFALLKERFPHLKLEFVPSAPRLIRGDDDWKSVLSDLKARPFDVLLCCISFPKQEYLSYDLGKAGCAHGVSICAGASIDFLTGRQKRAPAIFRKFKSEWLYRLISNPRRLARRYLIEGPLIFRLFWKLER
ncbi:WecB/TagA/CpsF family glycosyltransferase [Yoonia maritima]|uniref:WecB/TagA/CpsF family glycosyltransferase n=1 Tax=Yoonia maritima TaxID=1435347 RepID=UPI000D0F9A03